KKKDDKMESLILAIQSNRLKRAQNARDLFARLEAKYQNADEEGAARNATDKRENKKRRRKN
ncbi:DnaJ domain-containing protein, partial [Toxoplasma gondii VAND]